MSLLVIWAMLAFVVLIVVGIVLALLAIPVTLVVRRRR